MRHSISSLLLAVALAACGGGDGGGGSGVDSAKPLSEITPDEAMSLCEYFDSNAAENKANNDKVGCYYQGISVALEGGDCQMTVDACLVEAEMDPVEPEDCSTAGDEVLPECASEVTVGEMEACFEAMDDLSNDFAGSVSCSTDPAEFETFELPPACMQVQTDCPDLFSDG